MKIGILAMQGAVQEHVKMVARGGAEPVVVKRVEQLEELAGLIIPGGESTTIGKLMREYGFVEPVRAFAGSGRAIFGTCAGLIVIAKEIVGQSEAHLGLMDIAVARNAFGRQRESFETDLNVTGLAEPFPAVFIRAPLIERVGPAVEILAVHQGRIVAAKQDNLLASSFHPELTDDSRFHELFLEMAAAANSRAG